MVVEVEVGDSALGFGEVCCEAVVGQGYGGVGLGGVQGRGGEGEEEGGWDEGVEEAHCDGALGGAIERRLLCTLYTELKGSMEKRLHAIL